MQANTWTYQINCLGNIFRKYMFTVLKELPKLHLCIKRIIFLQFQIFIMTSIISHVEGVGCYSTLNSTSYITACQLKVRGAPSDAGLRHRPPWWPMSMRPTGQGSVRDLAWQRDSISKSWHDNGKQLSYSPKAPKHDDLSKIQLSFHSQHYPHPESQAIYMQDNLTWNSSLAVIWLTLS